MTPQELVAAMEAFEKKGGTIQQVAEGESTKPKVDPKLRYCCCGCHGNWTDHTMRLGERGVYSA